MLSKRNLSGAEEYRQPAKSADSGFEAGDGISGTLSFILSSLYLPASDYGLFLSDEDPRKGIWLEAGRTLDYYMLRNGVCCRFFSFFLVTWSVGLL